MVRQKWPIKGKRGKGMIRVIRALALAVTMAAMAVPLAAQDFASDGDQFLKAVRESDGGKAVDLIETKGSTVVNYRGHDGNSALHIVTRARNANWVGYLLGKGADPNIGDANGETPLILAARSGFSEGVARLLMNRAQVDKANKLGETALIVAVQQRHSAIVKVLLEAGANPDKQDYAAGYSARDYARRDTRSAELLRQIETVKTKQKAVMGPKAN
jgi:ankyrin repeat protein